MTKCLSVLLFNLEPKCPQNGTMDVLLLAFLSSIANFFPVQHQSNYSSHESEKETSPANQIRITKSDFEFSCDIWVPVAIYCARKWCLCRVHNHTNEDEECFSRRSIVQINLIKIIQIPKKVSSNALFEDLNIATKHLGMKEFV